MPHHHCNGEAFEHVTSPTGLPVYAKQYITKVGDTNNHGTPRERMQVGPNGTHCPLSVRLRLGTFTHRSSVLLLNASASKVFATIFGKRIKRASPTTNINLCPDSQTATQGTTNTGPPYRLDSSHQTEIYLRTSEALAAAREQALNRAAKPVKSGSPFSRL